VEEWCLRKQGLRSKRDLVNERPEFWIVDGKLYKAEERRRGRPADGRSHPSRCSLWMKKNTVYCVVKESWPTDFMLRFGSSKHMHVCKSDLGYSLPMTRQRDGQLNTKCLLAVLRRTLGGRNSTPSWCVMRECGPGPPAILLVPSSNALL